MQFEELLRAKQESSHESTKLGKRAGRFSDRAEICEIVE